MNGTNGIPLGNVIASHNPGDISVGQATQPANLGNIMQSMMNQLVSPEQVAKGARPVVNPAVSPQPVVNQPFVSQPVSNPNYNVPPVQPSAVPPIAKEPDVNLFAEEPKEAVVAPVDDEPDMSDIPDDPKTENWKKAREALKTERKTLKTLTQEFESAKAKLEKYEKGEIVPEVIAAKDIKIQELEKYATIVNGRLSDEYQELIAQPIQQKTSVLDKLAQDYGVPSNIQEALIKKIVETDNERERNSLITKYFPDAIGASKVETLVNEIQELGAKALELESKPKETFQSLQSQYQAKKQQEAERIASQFEVVSKGAWDKAMQKTAQEGLFAELILDPNNPEHNNQVEKNQHRAAIQFGAAVKKLHENGMKTIPEDFAVGLARSIQLSIGAVSVAKQLEAANARIAELEGKSGMLATYLRPGLNNGGQGRIISTTPDRGPMDPKQAGQAASAVFRRQ